MASTKDYLAYVIEQLGAAGFSDVRTRPMMGEYLLYVDSVLIGGIYDDRLLLKCVTANEGFGMTEVLPYTGAKMKMRLVEEVDDTSVLAEIVQATLNAFRID